MDMNKEQVSNLKVADEWDHDKNAMMNSFIDNMAKNKKTTTTDHLPAGTVVSVIDRNSDVSGKR